MLSRVLRPSILRVSWCRSVANDSSSKDLQSLLQAVRDKSVSIEDAITSLQRTQDPGYTAIGEAQEEYARIDHVRSKRTGFPEVIYGESKTPKQVQEILDSIYARGEMALATRVPQAMWEEIKENSAYTSALTYDDVARVIRIGDPEPERIGHFGVVCAGTSDLPVAQEAIFTFESMGFPVTRLFDVGVAGIHRLLDNLHKLEDVDVVLVVAGMDGALPAVVGGLVKAPVIGVPTSVGYGMALNGIAPLLTMLNACSTGVTVMNIDNGFGAAAAAVKMVNLRTK